MKENMKSHFLFLALALYLQFAHGLSRCGTHSPSSSERKEMMAKRDMVAQRHDLSVWQSLDVPVVFHIIHDGEEGRLTEEACQEQVDVLNEAFAGKTHAEGVDAKIHFHIHAINYIEDPTLFKSECTPETDDSFKKTYTVDPTRFFNIFTCDPSSQDLLGWSTLPQYYPEGHHQHAVVLGWFSLPGQSDGPYNLGDTATHEVGHFFGLLHTFSEEGLCSESSSDGVADTPLERNPNFKCNADSDSCPDDPGLDPVWNFMDYTDDNCMNRFTPGQVELMWWMLFTYKPAFVAVTTVSSTLEAKYELVSTSKVRLESAFDNSALVVPEIRSMSAHQCADLCETQPSCRALFVWFDGAVDRCRLLKTGNVDSLIPTNTTSSSYLRKITKSFKLVAEGSSAPSSPKKSRFANAFHPSSVMFRDALTTDECITKCLNTPQCAGVVSYQPHGRDQWRCNGLSQVTYTLVPTTLTCFSYAKSFHGEIAGFSTAGLGANIDNTGSSKRFAEAFDADSLIERIDKIDLESCGDLCLAEEDCEGIFHYREGATWRCRLLKGLGGKLVRTSLPSYSLTKNPPSLIISGPL